MTNRLNKILIINQNSGYLTIDVTNVFAEKYDEVVLITGKLNYTDRKLKPNVKIINTVKYDRTTMIRRICSWSLCFFHVLIFIIIKFRKYKILYYTNPPISYFMSLIFSNLFSIVIYDIYPNALKIIGVKEKQIIYKLWTMINKKIFEKAEKIITLSEGMKDKLKDYVAEEKIHIVSIWPALEILNPITKENNPFIRKIKMENKFIILYSGNMGKGYSLEFILDIAKNLKEYTKLHFLLIGEGTKRKYLEKIVRDNNIENVTFMDWQPVKMLPFSLASADLSLIPLQQEFANLSVPSKVFNYMSAGSPILGIGGEGSELEKLIKKHDIGKYFTNNQLEDIQNFILELSKNKDKILIYKHNSLEAAKNYTNKLSYNYLF